MTALARPSDTAAQAAPLEAGIPAPCPPRSPPASESRRGRSLGLAPEAVEGARAIAAPIGQKRVLTMLDHLMARTAPPSDESAPARAAGLTDREVEILPLLVTGASNKEIARSLFISENTAAKHLRSILTKNGATSRTRAAHHALTHAWVKLQ